MLFRENRLKKKRDFDRAHKLGTFVRFGFLSLKKVKNGLPDSRFGFLVGTKISKKAVLRNKIKRRLREVTRLNNSRIVPGYDVVVFVRPDILEKDYQEIETCLLSLYEKARILK